MKIKQNFFDEIDTDWGDLISNVYNNYNYFKPEYKIINGKKCISRIYKNEDINDEKQLLLDNDLCEIITDTFYNCTNLVGRLDIPDSVIKIGEGAFENCSELTSLKLSKNLENIEHSTFINCKRLSGELIIPDSVKSIKYAAFKRCMSFTGGLVIPETVNHIGDEAFSECSGFNSLKLNIGLKKIYRYAFIFCTGLSGELVIPETVEYIGDSAFYDCSFSKIYVPKININKYDIKWNIGCNAEIIEY